MRILVAVDGSECSDAAVGDVARRPWPAGSVIKVVSAMEPPSVMAMPETWGPPTEYYEVLEQSAEARARQAVDKAVRTLSAAGLPAEVSGEVLRGLPKEVILQEAERWTADLIVMGSHGYRGLKKLWLGSVSQAVASHAPCSVQIVRCRAQA
ncbi:MAG TPA: universal stress protein [Candidatus Polarisedimenticolia bacterium]|nr:universal stress protein [Candidatus Polarisedimenticolia bacterium]